MTFKEKIENLTWTDLIKKLKDIFSNINTKFDVLTGRISAVEANSGSGGGEGSQDLQSVLENGKIANISNGVFTLTDDSDTEAIPNTIQIYPTGQSITILDSDDTTYTTYRIGQIEKSSSGGASFYNLPDKVGGTHTLATLTDIYTLGLVAQIFADNAAAIAGFLDVGTIYQTPTGELRVVV